jgi:hypothetical protein
MRVETRESRSRVGNVESRSRVSTLESRSRVGSVESRSRVSTLESHSIFSFKHMGKDAFQKKKISSLFNKWCVLLS